ncbi:hypothetical protein RJ639_002562 [Escallonia herrerae]|uniref:Radical SAM core domain-containing protein n=1 Tax=Escallonia herrerae TaxID=1293975 RepID=A0AA89BGV2_9ASTE|nr:hypothetical protein RJ639_002562 [Escallonia herrerae]
MDHGTFDGEKFNELIELGVNRVSLGVQAFQEQLLRACGRAHGLSEVYEAIEIVGSCGVENWSMDLISSLPHQTTEMWEESLRLTVEAQPSPAMCLFTTCKSNKAPSLVYCKYTPGEFPLPSETDSAKFYRMASSMLSNAGYNHYEISSYSKNGFECEHNLTYWKNKPFYGFGLGSASYVRGVRYSRPRKLKEYTGYVQNLEDGAADCSGDRRCYGCCDALSGTARGLDLKSFREDFGGSLALSLCKVYKPYVESGHVVCLDGQRRNLMANEFSSLLSDEHKMEEVVAFIRLSDPDGFLLSNELISLAFAAIAP